MMHRSLSLFLLCATACVVWCSASTGNSGEGSHRIAVQNYIDLQRESLSLSGASQGAKTAEESVEHNNPQDQLRELKNTEFPNKDEVIPKLEVTKPPSLLLSAFLWLQELIAMVTDKKSDPEALTRGQKKDPLSTLVGSFCVGLALVVWIYYRVLRHNKRKLRNQDEIHKPAAPLGGPLLPVDADGASWRLHCGPGGRHTWHVEETEASPQVKQLREQFSRNRGKQLVPRAYSWALTRAQHPADLVWRSARTSTGSSASPAAAAFTTSEDAAAALEAALGKACAELRALQSEDGHWPCDYAGPHFLTPGYVFAAAIAGHEIPELERRELRRFLCNSQNADGGWPMHIEGPSTMFGTALNYPALRLLGASSSDPFVERGRAWLQAHGGALGVPSWGKLWLATIGCFEWEGLQPVPPELWSLPKWVPVHPNNLWCHARMVYLPMAYLYATKPSYPERLTDIVRQLRQEMFSTDYDKINWHAARWQLCPTDSFRPPSKLLALTHRFAAAWEAVVPNSVRRRALAAVLEARDSHLVLAHSGQAIRHEDEVTDFICLGPVNKMLNLVVRHLVHDDDVRERHWDRTRDYLWVSEDGMKCNGYNGCQVWDVAFAAQALMECSPAPNSELHDNVASTTVAALRFLDEAQVTSEVPRGDEFFRGAAAGGWGFSTRDQTWVVSDCTAEPQQAMLGCLAAHTNPRIPSEASLSPARLAMGADILLHWQNADGGWGTLESKRGPNWLELLNPSEVFGDIMVDYSHVECTSSVIRALTHFEAEFPELAASRADAIRQAVSRGVEHLRQRQNVDGSWKGFWAICYTYGTWFAVEGLRAAGAAEDDPAVEAACRFLLSKQNRDGGWGEDYSSCAVSRYVSCESQVVMTAWAVLTLLRGSPRYAKGTAVRHGIRYLLAAQLDNGDWPQERVSGSFNGNCTISYTNFRTIFPLWALARAHSMNTLPVLSSDPPLSDAIVVGGGPAGCASAVALARQGYRVTVIERDMRRPDRIIGELLQPGGVRALKDLGLEDVLNDDRFPVVNGYVVRLGHDEIPLAYPDAHVARSFHHGDFIQRLRAAAAAVPGVTFTEGTVAGLVLDDGAVTGVRFSPKHSETPCELRAPLTVVADGSFSNLRRVAGIPPASTTSRFAGLVLKAQPPSAGYAFVCLCDPSPALCYPISPTELRLLVDLPHSAADMIKASGDPHSETHTQPRTAGGTEAYIREFIVPQLPTDLQDPALEALSESSRIAQCQYLAPAPTTPPPGCWVIGDALSMRHPLTGGGMTVAFTDAVAMAQALEHGGTPRLGDTQAMDAVMRWWRQQRAATAGCINTLAQSLYGVARASKQDKSVAARELQAGMFAYFLQGPRCTSTPLRLLAGLENRRVLLLAHFFAVALVSSARAMRHSVMAPFQTFAHACAIIRPYAMELRMR